MLTCEQQLDIISRAWGLQDGSGYVFLPTINGEAQTKEERIRGYSEGPAFKWPEDKTQILDYMRHHWDDDLYWCPSMFERHVRRMEFAMDEHALWADLDEVDPHELDEFKPTIAWETSPGRYQALWLTRMPVLGVSWPGNENQKLTYFLGADSNGWDTTQLLRVPGWRNHKPPYRNKDGGAPIGTLLWQNGPRYRRQQFSELPEVQSRSSEVREIIESDLAAVDTHEVMVRVKLKLSKRVREFLQAREVPNKGARSEILWEIERELADAGCTLAEIIAIIQKSVWNKYKGRGDELLRLTTEASRALDEAQDISYAEIPKPDTVPRIAVLLANIKPPAWLIKDIWTRGSCGFIGGQPKTWKSWTALDMALSLATGSDFLGTFPVVQPGPVLYIQEEDPLPRIKDRFDKMWSEKAAWQVVVGDDGMPYSVPANKISQDPDVGMLVKQGIVLSDEIWIEWLRDIIAEGMDGTPYQAVFLDPLMYMLGDVDENRAGPMMLRIFKPLKVLASEFDIAVIVVHHMRKAGKDTGTRGGQLILGSVANHAWTEDSMYLTHFKGGDVHVEVESKTAPGGSFKMSGLRNRLWTPTIYEIKLGDEEYNAEAPAIATSNKTASPSKALASLHTLGSGTTKDVALHAGIQPNSAYKQLRRHNQTFKDGLWIASG